MYEYLIFIASSNTSKRAPLVNAVSCSNVCDYVRTIWYDLQAAAQAGSNKWNKLQLVGSYIYV